MRWTTEERTEDMPENDDLIPPGGDVQPAEAAASEGAEGGEGSREPDEGQMSLEQMLEKERNDRKADLGRLTAANQQLNAARRSLQARGLDLDESGNVVPLDPFADAGLGPGDRGDRGFGGAPTPGPQTQTGYEPDEEEIWTKPREYVGQRAQEAAREETAQALRVVLPVLDGLVETTLSSKYPDWGQIGRDVKETLKSMGFSNLTHAMTMPQHVETAVFAVRGRRLAAGGAPGAAEAEAARQQRVAAGASAGGASAAAPAGGSGLSPEEKEEARAMGLTDADYVKLRDGVVEIPVTGGGKR